MGCSACNPFSIPHQPPLPSFPPSPTGSVLGASPFRRRRADKRLVLNVHAHKHNRVSHFTPLNYSAPSRDNNSNNNSGGGGGGGGGGDDGSSNFFNFNRNPFFLLPSHFVFTGEEDSFSVTLPKHVYLLLITASASFSYFIFACSEARAKTDDLSRNHEEIVFEIRGGRRVELVPDYSKDEFVVPETMWSWWLKRGNSKSSLTLEDVWMKCRDLATRMLLPEGFPDSVTSDYLEYSLWRGVQGIAAQISGVLATQALLYAVGLGKGAIPTAAAVNWVLKDGIGYLSKIMLSKYGRHFDVNPKGWRLFADLLENAAFGMEILTPAFPHLFVPIGAVAGAGRSAAALIQAATRSCFYAGFAAQRNFAEVIAKGEAQGMA